MDIGPLVGISGLRISVQCVPEDDLDIPRDSLQGMTELLIVAFANSGENSRGCWGSLQTRKGTITRIRALIYPRT